MDRPDETSGSNPAARAPRRRASDRPAIQAWRLRVRRWLAEPKSPLWPAVLLVAISLVSAALLGGGPPSVPVLTVGEIATRTVAAPHVYRLPDADLTAAQRAQAESAVRPVYDYDPGVLGAARAAIAGAFAKGRDARGGESAFVQAAGIAGSPAVDELAHARFDAADEKAIESLLQSLDGRRIVTRLDVVSADLAAGVTERQVGKLDSERTIKSGEPLLDLDSARALLSERAALLAHDGPSRRELAVAIAAAALKPNLTLNAAETEHRRAAARDAVNDVYVVVQKGRAVVEAGHEVTPDQAKLLAAMAAADRKAGRGRPLAFLGLFLLAGSILGGVWAFGHRYMRRVPGGTRDLAVLGSLVLIGLALARLAHSMVGAADAIGVIAPGVVRFSVPAAATAIVAAVLFGAEGAALVATATALLSGVALEGDLRATIYVFLGSISAAGVLSLPQKRSDLLKAGLAAAVAQLGMVVAFSLFDVGDWSVGESFMPSAIAAAASGLLAGVLALGLVPAYEAFGYLTNFTLLELASLGSPLLKELSVQAPGTYHHSVIVGALAEAGAEAIGANPLFARVACYYHDIGKMKKPQYFIENRQSGEENLHDRLTPSMSALVVESHVKDGIEMGLAYGLPKAIVDVIPQHHGTRLISFFYNKAQKLAAEKPGDAAEIVESDFRYPGPKPQSAEAGIIMLADGVEASTRSITDPTPAKVRAMIKKVFGIVEDDGQLDECDLSLKDLARIADTFEKVLLGMYHRRVAYPSTADISGVKPGGQVLPLRKKSDAE